MCEMSNDCDYDGEMFKATGAKDVYLNCSENEKEYRIPRRLSVSVCPECGEADWRTLR